MSRTKSAFIPVLAVSVLLAGSARAGTVKGKVPQPADAVVFLDKVEGNFRPDGAAEIDQENLEFKPKVLVILQGTKVLFRNSDDNRHNVFGVGAEQFDLGTWTKGVTREHTFTKIGHTTLLCNVHPEMEGHVLVLQNPYYARPDSSGNFAIENVPPGRYNLIYWRPNKKAKKKPITVGDSTTEVAVD